MFQNVHAYQINKLIKGKKRVGLGVTPGHKD
jgi:hypothetical protein